MSEEIELLEKCADIFDKMNNVLWNEDSCWNDNSYSRVANEVYNFLNSQKKEVPECPNCGKSFDSPMFYSQSQ